MMEYIFMDYPPEIMKLVGKRNEALAKKRAIESRLDREIQLLKHRFAKDIAKANGDLIAAQLDLDNAIVPIRQP